MIRQANSGSRLILVRQHHPSFIHEMIALDPCIVHSQPFGQFRTIIRRGYPFTRFLAEPDGHIGTTSSTQDCFVTIHGNTEHPRHGIIPFHGAPQAHRLQIIGRQTFYTIRLLITDLCITIGLGRILAFPA